MIKRIVLHVGAPKTGTTYLQTTLYNNREIIETNGFLYLKGWIANHGPFFHGMFADDPTNLHRHQKENRTPEIVKEYCDYYLNVMRAEVQKSKAETIVFSGEAMFFLGLENLRRMLAFLREEFAIDAIDVYLYVRDLLVYWTSDCFQVQMDETFTLEDFKNRDNYLVFESAIRRYWDVFGEDHVKVCSFEKAVAAPYGMVGYFLKEIGFPEEALGGVGHSPNTVNSRISDKAMDAIQFFHAKLPLLVDGRINPGRFYGDTETFINIHGSKYTLDAQTQRRIFDLSRQDAVFLKERFGIDYTVEPAFADPVPIVFDTQYVSDIMAMYPSLSPVIQRLFYDYTQEKFAEPELDGESRNIFEFLLYWIENKYAGVVKTPLAETAKKLGDCMSAERRALDSLASVFLMPEKNIGFVYRMISCYLRTHALYESAGYFANRAHFYAPQYLLEEYQNDLTQPVAQDNFICTIPRDGTARDKADPDDTKNGMARVHAILDDKLEEKVALIIQSVKHRGIIKSLRRLMKKNLSGKE